MKSVVVDPTLYDWEGDQPLRRPRRETVVYELHVRGFTCHSSSGVAPERAGTYAGLIEKIPYLQDLGITAVELLPVFQFDPLDALPRRSNCWGYSPISLFVPHRPYSSRTDPLGPLDDFRDLVKALHRAGTKLIAEAWDVAGLNQVGCFIGDSWQEWNGHFRDDVRRFLKGDRGQVPKAALRLLGSPDIYGHEEREAEQSANFITCHDGFTLADLVAYNHKHNDANGEGNRDGADDNASWNCGVDGPIGDPQVLALRQRQIRNFLALLLLAIGTPMLATGG